VVPVEVRSVEQGHVRQTLTFGGDIRAELEVKVFSKVPDRIEKYYVDDGDRVRRGDPIAKVVSTTIEQAVRQAEAGLAAARAQHASASAEYERANRLYKENAISKQQFETIQAQYEATLARLEQAEAGLATAQSQLGDATVTSPIDGLIGIRYSEAGDMASPSAPMASVVQMDRVKIEFDATEEDLGSLGVGQKAEVRVRSYANTVFEGKILKISPVLDPMTRMATVEVLIPNPGHTLKPGMYAEVEVTVGNIENTLVVPRSSVFENTSLEQLEGERRVVRNFFVYVVNDSDRAEQRRLDVAYLNHTLVAVQSGVEVGERLVVSGHKNLRDGMAVLIPSASSPAPETQPEDVNGREGEEAR
jgi:membrane fusion protein (multidrug efflux system)/multidrug efflux system membrane fusion protein/cobalt-zinc-cadmium efflux system membrane fusion protein